MGLTFGPTKLDDQTGVASGEAHETSSIVRWMLAEKNHFDLGVRCKRLGLRQSAAYAVEARGQGDFNEHHDA